jgi:hypothetical protein
LIILVDVKQINLPAYGARIENRDGVDHIFDEVRRKWLVCTPEEWVRQHIIMYLHQNFHYPLGLMEVEKGMDLYGLKKRADIVLRDGNGALSLVVECKAPEIKIKQDVFDQVSRYNLVMKAPFLLVTNGMEIHCWKIDFDEKKVEFLNEIPTYIQK